MSLRVWLPLNGSLENRGLENVEISALGTVSYNDNGKIGKAFIAGGSSQNTNGVKLDTNLVDMFNENHTASVAVWVKPLGTHVHYNGTILSSGNWNAKKWAFGVSQDNTKVDVLSEGYNIYVNCTVPVNEWTHLVSTYDNGICKVYKNGEYVGQITRSNNFDSDATYTCVGRETYANGYFGFNGLINDIRIYDHALSEQEIKKIAQGLIVHYPLNRNGWGQDNLLINSTIPTSGAGASGVTKYITDDGLQKVVAEVGNSNWCTFNNHNTTLALTKGDTFTFSLMIRSDDSIKKPTVYFQSGLGYYSMQGTMSSEWSIIYYTGVWSIDNLTTNIHLGFSSAAGTYYIKYFKLEKGSVPTAWCPNVSDNLYSSLNVNNNTMYDISGFGNNGTIHGTFSYITDTPLYKISTSVIGSGSNYLEGIVLPVEAKTVSLWVKCAKSVSSAIFNDKTTGLQIGLLNSLIYTNSKSSTAGFTTSHWKNNDWNHVVVINNDGTRRCYVNGQPETQSGSSNYYIHNANKFWVWNRSYNNSYPYKGALSDLRIYTTALSADEVKELYEHRNNI